MEAVGGNQGCHVGTAKVDRAPAAQRPGAAHENKRFVGAGVLDDLLGFDQGASDLRAVLRSAGRTGAKSGAAAPAAGTVTACGGDDTVFPHMADSSRAVSGSCTAANRRQEVAS